MAKRNAGSRRRNNSYFKMMGHVVSALFTALASNYTVIVTLLFVVVLSLLLPEKSNKIQVNRELKDVKRLLSKISNEVKQAEVACLTVAEEICCLNCVTKEAPEIAKNLQDAAMATGCSMQTTQSEPSKAQNRLGNFYRRIFCPTNAANASNKEVTLMSFMYTDSFDAQKPTSDQ